MTQFAVESWYSVKDELFDLWPIHYAEVMNDDNYNPDIDQYQRMFDAGMMHITTARDEGKLVGYATALIQHHLHSKHIRWAMYDNYFLLPDQRKPGVFGRMMAFSEQDLRQRGVMKLYAAEPRRASRASTWFEGQAWDFSERVYTKELK